MLKSKSIHRGWMFFCFELHKKIDGSHTTIMGKEWLTLAKKEYAQMQKDRRYLHKNAEVGFDLPSTFSYVKKRLKELGYTPKPIGRYAIIAEIGSGNGCVLLRADADGLPIQEKSGEPFACKDGRMHACGHDLHTAMLLGAAAILKKREKDLPRKVRLLFQPAEEILQGGKDCVDAGVLDGVDSATMLHVLPAMPFPTGTLIVAAPGVSAPAADFFDLTVKGKGCHGSSPWQGVDAALVGAKILTGLEMLSSREISPAHFSTLTIGQFHAGDADNALAGKAVLSGTMRSMDEDVRSYIKDRLDKIAKTIAMAYRARAKVVWKSGCPCLQNDAKMSKTALDCAKKALGDKYVLSAADIPKGGVGGSEDFAYIAQKVPSVMVGICAGSRGQGFDEPLHSPRVRFDEGCMPYGAAYFAAVAFFAQTSTQKTADKKI